MISSIHLEKYKPTTKRNSMSKFFPEIFPDEQLKSWNWSQNNLKLKSILAVGRKLLSLVTEWLTLHTLAQEKWHGTKQKVFHQTKLVEILHAAQSSLVMQIRGYGQLRRSRFYNILLIFFSCSPTLVNYSTCIISDKSPILPRLGGNQHCLVMPAGSICWNCLMSLEFCLAKLLLRTILTFFEPRVATLMK